MGLFDLFFKKEEPTSKTLRKEDFYIVGTNYHQDELYKLAISNKDYSSKTETLIKEEKVMQKIFQYSFVNKPVKLEPEPSNKHDKNAIKVIIAGEHIGYIKREECLHVKSILTKHDVKYISASITGGKYKVVSLNGDVERLESNITVNVRIAYI